jgi:hypothetical protein
MFTKSKIFLSPVAIVLFRKLDQTLYLILKFPYPIAKQLPCVFLWKSKIHFNNGSQLKLRELRE